MKAKDLHILCISDPPFVTHSTPREVWKDIKGYEGLYTVSNLGRIKHLKKLRYATPKIMKLRIGRDGKYITVSLYKEHKYKTFRVHSIVAKTFILNTNKLPHVLHIDGNSKNNCVHNLKWGNDKENQLDRKRHGTDNTGERNGMSKLTEDTIRKVRKLRKDKNISYQKIANMHDVSYPCVYNAINFISWKHVK